MTLDEKKALVTDFLLKCNRYADDKLAAYRLRLPSVSGSEALELQDKIGHWTAYRSFNDYTLEELKTSALDAWFEEGGPK